MQESRRQELRNYSLVVFEDVASARRGSLPFNCQEIERMYLKDRTALHGYERPAV